MDESCTRCGTGGAGLEQPATQQGDGVADLRTADDAERGGDGRELLGIPGGVARGAGQPREPRAVRLVRLDRLQPPEGGGEVAPDPIDRGRDDDLDGVLPAHREVVLEHRHRVQVGRPLERLVQRLHLAHPVDRYARTARCGPVRHSRYHRPCRTTTAHGSTSSDHSVPASDRYRIRTRGRCELACTRAMVVAGSGRAAPGRAPARSCGGWPGPARPRPGKGPDDLAESRADRRRLVAGVVVTVEHGHHQTECLGGAEHHRWRGGRRCPSRYPPYGPESTTPGLPPRAGPRRSGVRRAAEHPEAAGQAPGGDAGLVLQQLAGTAARRAVGLASSIARAPTSSGHDDVRNLPTLTGPARPDTSR